MGADNRLFIEAVMWIAKTGALGRDLPPDYLQALPLLKSKTANTMLADKGYCADYIVEVVVVMGAEVVIPPKHHRRNPENTVFLCKKRNAIGGTLRVRRKFGTLLRGFSSVR